MPKVYRDRQSYRNKEFGSNKAKLEQKKMSEVIYEGGWFGMTHLSLWEHWKLFHDVHLNKYPFTVLEIDADTHEMISDSRLDMCTCTESLIPEESWDHLDILHGDVLGGLFNHYPKIGYTTIDSEVVYREPMFTYGHLDYCCNAIGLTEGGFELNLRRLANWWGLRRAFHLDITLSRRGKDGDALNAIMLDQFIPATFKSCRWSMVQYWKEHYHDSTAMTTAFYIFVRNQSSYKKYQQG